jgi:glycosyltransferase involved in cell wall biosynthesis
MAFPATKIADGVKLRAVIFSVAYEPLVGGAELAVRNITDRLPSYEFHLITCRFDRSHKAREQIGNVMVYRVGFGGRVGRYLYPFFAARLAKKLHQQKPFQLVWAIMAAYGAAGASLFLARYPRLKFLLTLQEGDAIEHIHGKVRGFRRLWQGVFRRADAVQAISTFLADWARKEGAAGPVHIVPNGVDLKLFAPGDARAITSDPVRIITVSRLVPKNGVDILIEALAQQQDKRVELWILGKGPQESTLRALANGLHLENRIKFFGEIAPDKVPEYLHQATIFARSSRSEGLGSAFLEAMAAGLPVVGTEVGGIPDFLTDRVTGLVCKPEDPRDLAQKLDWLLHNVASRENLARAGRELVEQKYNWDKIASQMEHIFQTI